MTDNSSDDQSKVEAEYEVGRDKTVTTLTNYVLARRLKQVEGDLITKEIREDEHTYLYPGRRYARLLYHKMRQVSHGDLLYLG